MSDWVLPDSLTSVWSFWKVETLEILFMVFQLTRQELVKPISTLLSQFLLLPIIFAFYFSLEHSDQNTRDPFSTAFLTRRVYHLLAIHHKARNAILVVGNDIGSSHFFSAIILSVNLCWKLNWSRSLFTRVKLSLRRSRLFRGAGYTFPRRCPKLSLWPSPCHYW